MTLFVAGLLVMGYGVAALFFARFYRQSRDRLFLFFAAGFALLAVQRLSLAAAELLPMPVTTYYVLRLAAFVVILAGILDKNRTR
jgi:hypothetical protein